jgi:hypothetical protein
MASSGAQFEQDIIRSLREQKLFLQLLDVEALKWLSLMGFLSPLG